MERAIAWPVWRERAETEAREVWRIVVLIYNELWRTRAFTIAAALAYYFLLSLVPLIVIFSSLLQFLPVPDVFQGMLNLMAEVVPADSLNFVETILASILTPNRGKLLSFGVAGYLWAATGGFSSLIEALDIAYDVPDKKQRSWWRNRLQALLLTFTSGGLVSISLVALLAGPEFGHFLTRLLPIPQSFEHLWPLLRLAVTFLTFFLSLELIYYLGPNTTHRFSTTQPGALVAITVWFLGSTSLSYYLGHLSNYNTTYGSMGALVGLMLWFYMTAVAILIGAELNAELCKRRALRARG
ncbi:YihY/virulence factor BrkB family protein [Silvibacterium sp.]|uniref:YihY/virulence factor BrkB family protein n=1 Tax=Silvibacterium sp. TaxID=1964179 RepID=UPI0039E2F499